MKQSKTMQLVSGGLVAAIYVALGVAFAPIGYGPVQLRVAEALTLLPVFGVAPIWGLTLGCAITNAYGVASGMSILGPLDIVFGTMATFLAAVATYWLRNHKVKGLPLLAVLPPVIFNAIIIGGELTFAIYGGGWSWGLFTTQALLLAVEQTAACGGFGLLMVYSLNKLGLAPKLFGSDIVTTTQT